MKNWSYEGANVQAKSLTGHIRTAKREGLSHVIIGRGFGLTEARKRDTSKIDVIILGNNQDTETFMERITQGVQSAKKVLKAFFRPGENMVYKSSENSRLHPGGEVYSRPPFSNGEYDPFVHTREVMIFDFRKGKSV